MTNDAKRETVKLADMEPKFRGRAVGIIIVLLILMFLNSSAASDSINVITSYFPETFGWSDTQVALPQTIGSLISIPLLALAAVFYHKFSTLHVLRVSFLIQGICVILIGVTCGHYWGYATAAIVVRMCSTVNQFGTYKLCTDWFNSWRGRILGIVTIAGPISSASTAGVLTAGNAVLGFSTTFVVFGIVVLVLCVASTFISKSYPEDYGLAVDGVVRTPEELAALDGDVNSPSIWTLKAMIRTKEYWIVTFAIAFFAMAMSGTMQMWIRITVMGKGLDMGLAIVALSIGSLLGIPISMVSGVIDDKFGTNKAAFFVWMFMIVLMLCMIFITPACAWLVYVATFCVGAVTGCFPNINPSIKAYTFGRKAFVTANSVSAMIENLFMSGALIFLSIISDLTGSFTPAYVIHVIITAIFAVLLLTIKPMAPEVIGVEAAKEIVKRATEPRHKGS